MHQRIYDQIIQRGLTRGLPKRRPKGFERHHIIPISLGGTDDVTNLVDLTPREHFIAHWLLKRIHGGKMAYAFWRMCQVSSVQGHRPTSSQYEWARSSAAKLSSQRLIKQNQTLRVGRPLSEETRKIISQRVTDAQARRTPQERFIHGLLKTIGRMRAEARRNSA
jgi:hypothetical protein